MEYKKFSIWCKSIDDTGREVMFKCKDIYQKWGEEDTPFKRRAKRVYKQYSERNAAELRKFFLIEDK